MGSSEMRAEYVTQRCRSAEILLGQKMHGRRNRDSLRGVVHELIRASTMTFMNHSDYGRSAGQF